MAGVASSTSLAMASVGASGRNKRLVLCHCHRHQLYPASEHLRALDGTVKTVSLQIKCEHFTTSPAMARISATKEPSQPAPISRESMLDVLAWVPLRPCHVVSEPFSPPTMAVCNHHLQRRSVVESPCLFLES